MLRGKTVPASYGGGHSIFYPIKLESRAKIWGKMTVTPSRRQIWSTTRLVLWTPRSAAMRAISVAPAGERESMDSFKSIRNALEIARPIPTQTRIYPAISTRAGRISWRSWKI